jgi:transcriptional regulator with XRE-family HTH domain
MDTKTARKRKGWSQTFLATKAKTDQGTVSGVESGRVSLNNSLSKRLGSVLGVSGDELIFEYRARAMECAIKEGHAAGVFNAAKALCRVAEGRELTPLGEKRLNDLAERAVKFVQGDDLGFDDERGFEVPSHKQVD